MSRQPVKTLDPDRLQDRIRLQLEQDIQTGKLAPGMAIDEKALAQSFETSRTPVREALLLLGAKGLVDIIPRTGIYVHRPSASELVAMMEALGELEGVLARLAALRLNSALAEALRLALQGTAEQAAAQDAAAYERANAALHEVIYTASSNPFIVEQTRTVRLRMSAFRGQLFEKAGRLVRSQAEHEAVVSAILAGDAEAAAEAMREHISQGGKVFADLVLSHKLQ